MPHIITRPSITAILSTRILICYLYSFFFTFLGYFISTILLLSLLFFFYYFML